MKNVKIKMENDNVKSKNIQFLINNMQKQKSIISLNTIPAAVFSIVLIIGLGAVIGLWAYEIFETDKKLSLYNNICNDNNIAQKKDKVDDEYFGNEFIQVKSPQENNTIKSPVLVSGKANVFEANVRVRMKDDNKNILADTFITASGAYDKLYSFEKEIEYLTPSSQNGFIEVFEENAKDGSEINKIIIPVVFEDYMDVSGWKTYRNEEYGFEIKYPNDRNHGSIQYDQSETSKYFGIVFCKSSTYDEQKKECVRRRMSNNHLYYEGTAKVLKLISTDDSLWKNKRFGIMKFLPCDNGSVNFINGIEIEVGVCNNVTQAIWKKSSTDLYVYLFYDDSPISDQIFNQMLSTFKFIEK